MKSILGIFQPKSGLFFRGFRRWSGLVVACMLTISNSLHAQWVQTNGLYGGTVNCFAVSGTNLFAGTAGGGVWRRPLSEMTSVAMKTSDLPSHFSLDQNYPNPFNPTTTITYQLPKKTFVKLSIYNLYGQLIETLVSQEQPAGYYSVTWDARKVATGVYIY